MNLAKENVKNIYTLSPMQEGMLFHFLADKNSTAYSQQISWRINGNLDLALFEAAWNKLIRRHDILRTVFIYKNTDRSLQVVLKEHKIDVYSEDIRNLDHNAQESFIRQFKTENRTRRFDLGREIPMRVSVLQLGNRIYEAILSHHHIIMDGWSLGILIKESLEIYRALRKNQEPKLSPAKPFSQYIKWLETHDTESSNQFWSTYLAGYEHAAVPPQMKIETGKSSIINHQSSIDFTIDKTTTIGLTNMANRHNVTLNMVLQSIWGILLSIYNDVEDVVFGTVVSGRPPEIPGIEQMVGIFINTIPVRICLRPEITIGELVRKTQEDAVACKPHHYFPLARIQAETLLRNRIIGSLVVMENYPIEEIFSGSRQSMDNDFGFTVERTETFDQTHYDFGIRFLPDDVIRIRIGYNTELYAHDQIARIKGHFQEVARIFSENNDEIRIKNIDILAPEERNRILVEFNNTTKPFPSEKTIVDLFEAQVEQTPESKAVVFEAKTLTYIELNKKANNIAGYLQKNCKIQSDDRIGLLLDRSEWMIIGILGALKAGGAYVPIDSSCPAERIRYILSDSGCRVLLADNRTYKKALEIADIPVVDITSKKNQSAICNRPAGSDLAYVIYTSGSTGKPKGVMIEHKSVVNLVCGMKREVYGKYKGSLNIAMVTSYVFDASVQQIFSALLQGHTLFIVSDDIKVDNQKFINYLLDREIDIGGCVPNFLSLMAETTGIDKIMTSLKHFLAGGEILQKHLVDTLFSIPGKMRITNLYGPTECCVNATSYTLDAESSQNLPLIPTGKPLSNVQIYILNQNNKLSPIAVPGEICISGAGLARGYLNNKALSIKNFVRYPFKQGKRLYRTGDRGRWLPDGNIEFLGRYDDQVKIRGYRIEPAEIENQLQKHPFVREAAVVTKGRNAAELSLCACIVTSEEISTGKLRSYLKETLPDYMIPSYFVKLEKLPVTLTGKIDRNALSELETSMELEPDTGYVPPRTKTEQKLVEVWQAVLGRNDIGIQDNYFLIGGDSIKAIQMVSRLLRDNLKIEIQDVFNYPTISELASHVINAVQDTKDVDICGKFPLTAIQKRFFVRQKIDPQWFNHAVLLHARHGFRKEAVERVFAAIQQHHDILRARYYQDNEHWVQEIASEDDFVCAFEFADLRKDQNFRETIRRRGDFINKNLNLQAGPLMKVLFFRTGEGDQIMIVIHHLLIDGISWRILLEDFALEYQRVIKGQHIRFPAKTDSFKHWATEMVHYAQSDFLLKEKSYWASLEAKSVPVLPVDHESNVNSYSNSETICIRFAKKETETILTNVNHAYTTTTEDILLTALVRAIYRWKHIDRTLITLEGHGRENVINGQNISRTVGWFTSIYPVLFDLPVDRDIGYQIKVIKETIRKVPNRGIGYGILKYLTRPDKKKELSFSLNPQIGFNYLGQFDADAGTELFAVSTDLVGKPVNPEAERLCELEISGIILNNELEITVSYNNICFEKNSVTEFLNGFQEEMRKIIWHCQKKKTTDLTPADLTCSELSIDELEGIIYD
ncbi:MAG: hypothetical protein BBJ57_13610 [Desulfobacterales bacterium PC51MH44]|nr:MAG: hypothetical protein BBJ57_13610 [Desulfobacterales bacterium PC51MH44]